MIQKRCDPVAQVWFFFFLAIAMGVGSSAFPRKNDEGCPSYVDITPCRCRNYEGMALNCMWLTTKRFLEVMDYVQSKKLPVKVLSIEDSDLAQIPEGSFDGMQIETLAIRKSKVDSFGEKVFAPLAQTLSKLDLDYNQLKSVPTDSLSYLQSLEILHLRSNKIQHLHSYAFNKLQNLKELHLGVNNIASVDALAFGDCCRNLNKLDLSSNMLTVIPTESFFTLSNLTLLRMDNNKIGCIGKEAFSGLTQLNTLDLASNQISSIDDYAFRKSSTQNLILARNNLETLNKLSYVGLEDSTQWIELAYNKFTTIPTQSLAKCSRLRHLDLSHNKITELEDYSFAQFGQHLRYIELNNNQIQRISPKALLDLESVEFLMLAHNNLTNVPRATVQSILDTVFMLDLSGNLLKCSCDLQWLKDWLDSLDPLDRMSAEPSCYVPGALHFTLVRHLACTSEEGELLLSTTPCFSISCMLPHVEVQYHGRGSYTLTLHEPDALSNLTPP